MAQHKILILRLRAGTVAQLAMVAARENKEVEGVVENLLERSYSPDGRTKTERASMSSKERIAELSRPVADRKSQAEIDRLSKMIGK